MPAFHSGREQVLKIILPSELDSDNDHNDDDLATKHGVWFPNRKRGDARDGVRDVFETSVTLEAFLESKPDADALRAPRDA